MTWHEGLTLLALAMALGPLLWIVFVRRELFDPRVYVLGGMFHWLLVSQVITTFGIAEQYFEFNPYEATYGFKDSSYLIMDSMIVLSIVAFLVGFSVYAPRLRDPDQRTLESLRPGKLAGLVCATGYVGFLVFRAFELDPTLPIEPVLLIAYLMPASSVLALYLLLSKASTSSGQAIPGQGARGPAFLAQCFLVVLPLVTILRTNVALIYPLCALLFFLSNRDGFLRIRVNALLVLTLPVFIAIAIVVQAGVKAYNAINSVMDLPLLGVFTSLQYQERISRALLTFDIFNAESYSVLVHMYELYVEPGQFKWGVSLLAAFPVTKLLWRDEIKGLGRRFILDTHGIDTSQNTALAISPVGEMLVNFTFVGLVAFYFLLGLLCAHLYAKIKQGTSLKLFALYPIFLAWLFVQQRGDFLNGNMYPGYIFLVCALLLELATKRRPVLLDAPLPKPQVR